MCSNSSTQIIIVPNQYHGSLNLVANPLNGNESSAVQSVCNALIPIKDQDCVLLGLGLSFHFRLILRIQHLCFPSLLDGNENSAAASVAAEFSFL